jgi:ring-1,2-phenylacetyl-CoA epoxidase subunit PaaA
MMFHGPADKVSKHTEMLVRWKIKLKTNDQQRQQFLRQFMPKILDLGLTVPDPNLGYEKETDTWRYTEPDWEEFKKVVRGGGPMSQGRMGTRRLAHEEGRWVREALSAAAEKKAVPMPPANGGTKPRSYVE